MLKLIVSLSVLFEEILVFNNSSILSNISSDNNFKSKNMPLWLWEYLQSPVDCNSGWAI